MVEEDHLRELVRRVKRLRLRALRRVRTRLAGSYASVFRGPGIEFSDFTPYQPGHDVRRIDWQVTARRREPYVRRYEEERELRVLIGLDVSRSMDSGRTDGGLRGRACLVAAGLALSAAANRDRVGALLFAQDVLCAIPPRRGEKHALNVVRQGLGLRGDGPATDFRPLLHHVYNLRGHAVVLVISDFFCAPAPWDARVRRLLAACAGKHDLLAVRLLGPTAKSLPAGVVFEAREAESHRQVRLDTFGARAGEVAAAVSRHRQATRETLNACGVRLLELGPEDDHLEGLGRLLAAMARRR